MEEEKKDNNKTDINYMDKDLSSNSNKIPYSKYSKKSYKYNRSIESRNDNKIIYRKILKILAEITKRIKI